MNIDFLDWGELQSIRLAHFLLAMDASVKTGTNGSRGGLQCVILRDILKLKVFIQLGEPRGKALPW